MKGKEMLLALAIITTLGGAVSCGHVTPDTPYAHLYETLPFDMPVLSPPQFADNAVSVTDFGAIGDGKELNTEAFAKAIDALSQKGGGRLVVPAGVWLTGPIVLKSHINLHLENRSIILFSPDKDLYPLVETSFEGLDTRRCQSPISGIDLENVAITGSGAIDGNGHFWRPLKKQKVTESYWKRATSKGGVFKRDDYWMPSAQYLHADTISDMNVPRHFDTDEQWAAVRDFLRPVMVSFQRCKNVYLQGVIFQNSPAWNIHPLMCENVIVDGIQVRNPSYAQNGDGLDLESCRNVIVVNSSFDVGDDGICIKSGKDEDGRRRARPCENVIIDNCTVFKGHGGFVVGSEMSGGVKNIKLTNCSFLGTDVGLRFKSRRGRGGVVENIYVSNVSMIDITTDSFLFDLFYGGKSAVEVLEEGSETSSTDDIPVVTDETPAFRNIYFNNVVSRNARRAMFFNGIPEMPIDNINIENVSVTARYGAEFSESTNINLKNVHIVPAEGSPLVLKNVKNFHINGFDCPDDKAPAITVNGKRTAQVQLPTNIDASRIVIAPDVNLAEILK